MNCGNRLATPINGLQRTVRGNCEALLTRLVWRPVRGNNRAAHPLSRFEDRWYATGPTQFPLTMCGAHPVTGASQFPLTRHELPRPPHLMVRA